MKAVNKMAITETPLKSERNAAETMDIETPSSKATALEL